MNNLPDLESFNVDGSSNLGLKFNKAKCLFVKHEVSLLGDIIGRDEVRMDETKVHALKSARSPINASELKLFLGLASFYSLFIPNVSTLTGPLRQLL